MNFRILNSFFLITAATLFLSGCATVYTPPEIPKNQMAHIKETKMGDLKTTIVTIDHKNAKTFSEHMGLNILKKEAWVFVPKTYNIAPGRRVILLKLVKGDRFAHGQITFTAQSGRTYYVQGNVGEREGGFWTGVQYAHFMIKEEQNDEIVGESHRSKSSKR